MGAVVLAAGWQPYDPAKLDAKLGYGASPTSSPTSSSRNWSPTGKITRPSDGKAG